MPPATLTKDELDFRECVADTATSEIAAAVNIDSDGFHFPEGFDSGRKTL